jgi:AraC-like DNA-binding protein
MFRDRERLAVCPAIATYRHQLLSGSARLLPGDEGVDPRSVGVFLDDPDGYLRLEQITLGPEDAVISRVASTAYKGRLHDDTYFTFVLQQAGRYDVNISGRDYSMSPGHLVAFRPNDRDSRVRAGKAGFRAATTLQVPTARMGDLLQAMETSTEVVFPHDGNGSYGKRELTLARILPQLADDLLSRSPATPPPRVAQEIRHLIDEVLCEMIGRTVEQTSSRRVFPAFHRVRLAEEMMRAHSDEPLSVLDLANALGVSLRSLQLAFAEVHGGLTPRAVLYRIRLEKARARLLAAGEDSQVTTIAHNSGFSHLSRFAQAYARTYGERPSETLARRRT